MIVQEQGDELVLIRQTDHAVLSGFFAREWGNDLFQRPEPFESLRLAATEHDNVKRAIVLLRLAVALNQDRASDVLRVTVRTYPKRVLIEIRPGRTGAELELWSLRKEADYFREVFRRELFAVLA